ncbi:hypothetical protein MKK70_25515 [Methylobacterium sp. E-041]|uniref:hypothetical protein n=1 Tax=unclassified Methylobacterium TaxID=2615210 RepID=UPI001FB9AE79|nr:MULTISPECIES: hypothetical protein [unclassified Methylobacterium]MCJ2010292.1 hypothetical protein [Methylobacterium sp. J-092]MCJ2038414.1 hypothetical protein [Methylobacterium sp. J-059]MCJ2108670.1 hypothetical protein [Methylobacterium sp. E-041]MCJ2114340.1 hypothetical protein [Methylobacterium sp. E-025]
MVKSDLHPPHSGPGSDPVLYGVAAGLAELFPPVTAHPRPVHDRDRAETDEPDQD